MSLYLQSAAPQGVPHPLGYSRPPPPTPGRTPAYSGEDDSMVFNHFVKNDNHWTGRDMTQVEFDAYSITRPPMYGYTGSVPDPSKMPIHVGTPNVGGGRVTPMARA